MNKRQMLDRLQDLQFMINKNQDEFMRLINEKQILMKSLKNLEYVDTEPFIEDN